MHRIGMLRWHVGNAEIEKEDDYRIVWALIDRQDARSGGVMVAGRKAHGIASLVAEILVRYASSTGIAIPPRSAGMAIVWPSVSVKETCRTPFPWHISIPSLVR